MATSEWVTHTVWLKATVFSAFLLFLAMHFDSYTLILLRRKASNKPLLDRFELPRSMFVVTKPGQ